MENYTDCARITNPSENGEDEVRNRRRLMKEEINWKKKMKREEEFLINLRKPKDTKVVLADRAAAERLLERLNKNPGHRPKRSLDYPPSSEDFPELSASCFSKSASSKISKTQKYSVNDSGNDISQDFLALGKNTENLKNVPPVQVKESGRALFFPPSAVSNSVPGASSRIPSVPNDQISSVESYALSRTHQEPCELRKGRTIKRKDPIVLNISDLIVNKMQRKNNKELNNMHNCKYRRGGENYHLSGNMLDSSNPKRRRGKQRENKKRKLTKLKFAIIKDRILKFKARKVSNADAGTESVENENLDIKVEVDKYLSDSVSNKLKFQKKKMESENGETIRKETGDGILNFERHNESDHEKKYNVNANGEGDRAKADNQTKKNRNIRKHTIFRKYCENAYKEDLDLSVTELIERIVYLQDKAFIRDPIRARAKRRFVTGFREVQKYLMLKKVKILIIAPDLEAQESVFNKVEELKRAAASENVPCIFALNRRRIGFISRKIVPVSVFGILNYEGLENCVETVKLHLKDAQMAKLNSQPLIEYDGTNNKKLSDTLLKLISDQ